MHILLVHQLFIRPDDPGGTRHYELARGLVARGHRVTILAGTRSYLTGEPVTRARREVLEPGLEIIRCGSIGGVHRSFVWRTLGFLTFTWTSLIAGLRLGQADVVWGTSPPLLQAASAWAIARAKRLPLVFEVRDLWPAFAIQVGVLKNRLLIALSRWLERFLYRHAERIVVNSPGFIPHLVASGAPEDRIALIPNGVDVRMFDPKARGEAFRSAHGLESKFVALYAGAHGLSNDLSVVLDAAERLRGNADISLVLVGDGKEKPALFAQAETRRLTNMHLLPPVPKDAMPEVLAAADCGIAILRPLPLYATTYPNKVFDYMAAGRPVVLAVDGVVRELVEKAGAGIFATPGDGGAMAEAIRRLASDRAEARRMGERGRKLVEAQFDRPRQTDQLERLLLEVAGSPRRAESPA
ncbi:MAG TPA: glycosyltransferase family 4 protein [Anaerolineales bacterium]|nr:glycosyltransferase family 4 protein [Anaerolineales bacterium]